MSVSGTTRLPAAAPIHCGGLAAKRESPPLTIEALIAGIARDGDRDCFATLFTQFAPKVKTYMLRHAASEAVAEDLTQEVFVTIWWQANQLDPSERSGVAWIFMIARDLCVQRLGLTTTSTGEPISPWRPIFETRAAADGPSSSYWRWTCR